MEKEIELTDYQQAILEAKLKQKALMSEDYQVVIKLPHQPNNWRITYNGKNGKKVKSIEEMNGEEIISCSTFRGKSCNGFCSADIKYFKPMLMMKASTIAINNPQLVIEEYFKKH